jgi:hypothetical protein
LASIQPLTMKPSNLLILLGVGVRLALAPSGENLNFSDRILVDSHQQPTKNTAE